jgi:phage head maturation protease
MLWRCTIPRNRLAWDEVREDAAGLWVKGRIPRDEKGRAALIEAGY